MTADLEKRRPEMRCELNGVALRSRYDDPAEIEVMMRALMVLPPALQAQIEAISCDSKACSSYSITLRWPGQMEAVARRLCAAFVAADGGYNWLDVECGEQQIDCDPDWPDEAAA